METSLCVSVSNKIFSLLILFVAVPELAIVTFVVVVVYV